MENDTENLIFGGALPDPRDERDHVFDVVGASVEEIDWEKGFDVRDVIGSDLQTKNQYMSYSCSGQAASQYVWVLQAIEQMKTEGLTLQELWEKDPNLIDEISAKAIYSQISLGKGVGAYIRDAALLIKNTGALFERWVPSYKPDGTTDEDFMFDKSWKDEKINWDKFANFLQAKDAQVIYDKTNMDVFARAIKNNFGILGGLNLSSGHGWSTERPAPPNQGESSQGHCLYFGAYGQDEFGKFIAFPNSWGKIVKEIWVKGSKPGTGWQKIYKDYFESGNVFNPWTISDKPNEVPHLIE